MKKPYLPAPNPISAEKMYEDRWNDLQAILQSRIKGYLRNKTLHAPLKHVFRSGYFHGMEDQHEKDNTYLEEQFSKKKSVEDDE